MALFLTCMSPPLLPLCCWWQHSPRPALFANILAPTPFFFLSLSLPLSAIPGDVGVDAGCCQRSPRIFCRPRAFVLRFLIFISPFPSRTTFGFHALLRGPLAPAAFPRRRGDASSGLRGPSVSRPPRPASTTRISGVPLFPARRQQRLNECSLPFILSPFFTRTPTVPYILLSLLSLTLHRRAHTRRACYTHCQPVASSLSYALQCCRVKLEPRRKEGRGQPVPQWRGPIGAGATCIPGRE